MEISNNKDTKIINEILSIFKEPYIEHKYYNDGTRSRVILLNNKYLIKQNDINSLKAETEFLNINKGKYIQKILYIEPNYEYVVYEFILGEPMRKIDNLDDLLKNIISIVSNYKQYNKFGYGYMFEELQSWTEFLESEIESSSKNIEEYIPDKRQALNSIKELEKYPFTKKLLHGDFGTHNFIKRDNKFAGVIDPMPVIGDPLYDLLFAIVSNANIIKNLELEQIYKLTEEPMDKVKNMLIMVLYSRISRCLKYHPQDIDIYMKYWNNLIKE